MKKNKDNFYFDGDIEEQFLDDLIIEAMRGDLDLDIPEGFADRMEKKAQQINRYRYWKEEFLKHLLLMGGALVMLAIAFGVFYYYNPENSSGILAFLAQFKWMLLGGFVLLFGIQMADSWAIKKIKQV
ncbi:MAG: hypothetical protein JW857_11740 [Bacteroidales bacterium]|nr:hypothetical protein [Bacteroidales bacterium]